MVKEKNTIKELWESFDSDIKKITDTNNSRITTQTIINLFLFSFSIFITSNKIISK